MSYRVTHVDFYNNDLPKTIDIRLESALNELPQNAQLVSVIRHDYGHINQNSGVAGFFQIIYQI